MGVSLVLVGISHFWRGPHPHSNKQECINPGSTVPEKATHATHRQEPKPRAVGGRHGKPLRQRVAQQMHRAASAVGFGGFSKAQGDVEDVVVAALSRKMRPAEAQAVGRAAKCCFLHHVEAVFTGESSGLLRWHSISSIQCRMCGLGTKSKNGKSDEASLCITHHNQNQHPYKIPKLPLPRHMLG